MQLALIEDGQALERGRQWSENLQCIFIRRNQIFFVRRPAEDVNKPGLRQHITGNADVACARSSSNTQKRVNLLFRSTLFRSLIGLEN
jgi:hypothetical protein